MLYLVNAHLCVRGRAKQKFGPFLLDRVGVGLSMGVRSNKSDQLGVHAVFLVFDDGSARSKIANQKSKIFGRAHSSVG